MPGRGSIMRGGTELVYWTWAGTGPTALLLHGIGNYGRYWDLFAAAIAQRMHLVASDARGHGESGRPPTGYAADDFTRDALAILDELDIERAIVVGHSMGGVHAINLASRHGDRVTSLAIVDASPEPLAAGAERARRLLSGRPARFADRAEARAYFERTSPGYIDAVYENRLAFALREDDGALVWRSDPGALEQIMSGRTSVHDRWDALAAIAAPTLVVRGTRSNVLDDEVARRMVQTLPDGRLMELEAGHNVPLDRPRELADAVVAFSGGASRR